MSDSPVLFTQDGPIAWLTLNRPDMGNCLDFGLVRALLDAAIRCDADPSIRCVVLTGSGRLFCAGGDIGVFAASGERTPALLSELAGTLHMAVSRLARMAKPLVVVVNGPAAGAGLSLALLGDVVLAARSAHFTAAYTAIGLTSDGGLTWLLPRLVGLRKAQEMLLTNRRVLSDEAAAIGLVTRVVDDADLQAEAAAVAASFARSAVAAVGAVRSLLNESFTSGFESQMEKEARTMAAAAGTSESAEGIAAFMAKRKPCFPGAPE